MDTLLWIVGIGVGLWCCPSVPFGMAMVRCFAPDDEN